jgi:hypothetical protein
MRQRGTEPRTRAWLNPKSSTRQPEPLFDLDHTMTQSEWPHIALRKWGLQTCVEQIVEVIVVRGDDALVPLMES